MSGSGPPALEHALGLHAVLEAELEALRGGDAAAIERLAEAKHTLAAALAAALSRPRKEAQATLVVGEAPGPEQGSQRGLDPGADPELVDLLRRCQDLNRRNGLYIQMRSRHNDWMLRLLHGLPEPDPGPVYDGRGRPQTVAASRYRTRA